MPLPPVRTVTQQQFHVSSLSSNSPVAGILTYGCDVAYFDSARTCSDQCPLLLTKAVVSNTGALRLADPLYGQLPMFLLLTDGPEYQWVETAPGDANPIAMCGRTTVAIKTQLAETQAYDVACYAHMPRLHCPPTQFRLSPNNDVQIEMPVGALQQSLQENPAAFFLLCLGAGGGLAVYTVDVCTQVAAPAGGLVVLQLTVTPTGSAAIALTSPVWLQILDRQAPLRVRPAYLPASHENLYRVTVQYVSVPLHVPRASANFRCFQDIPYYWLFVHFHGCQSVVLHTYGDDTAANQPRDPLLPSWCLERTTIAFRINTNTFRMTGNSGFGHYHGTSAAHCVITDRSGQRTVPDVVLADCFRAPVHTECTLLPEAAAPPGNVISVGIEVHTHGGGQ